MNILKRLKNIWKLGELEFEEVKEKVNSKKQKMATIIRTNDDIDEILK